MARPIDADKLMEGLNRKKAGPHDRKYTEGFNDALMRFRSMVHSAPTVSPDEVRGVGKWEQKEVFSLDDTTIEQMQSARCSSCGKYHTTPFSYYFSKYNYCPSCGARMGGVQDALS